MSDFIGEEMLIDKTQNTRQESAYSEGDTYLLEIFVEEFKKLRGIFAMMGLKKDFLNIEN